MNHFEQNKEGGEETEHVHKAASYGTDHLSYRVASSSRGEIIIRHATHGVRI